MAFTATGQYTWVDLKPTAYIDHSKETCHGGNKWPPGVF